MKIHLISDLHGEYANYKHPAPSAADIVVALGDIHTKKRTIPYLQTLFPNHPVIFVPGNHDYYGGQTSNYQADWKEQAEKTNGHITLLIKGHSTTIQNITFIGATLWSNLDLFGRGHYIDNQAAAEDRQYASVRDFKKIRTGPPNVFHKFTGRDYLSLHNEDLRGIHQSLQKAFGKKVLLTHHLPSAAIYNQYTSHHPHLDHYDASNLDELVQQFDAALHGHVHTTLNYQIGNTPTWVNAYGGDNEDQNPKFSPNLLIDI